MTLGLVLPLISSCIFDDEVIVEEKQDPVMVTFSLDVKSPAATRADDHTWGDNTDNNGSNDYLEVIGNTFENKIDVSTLYVVAYNADYSFKAELPILHSKEENGVAKFVCALPDFQVGNEYRFVVLANCINDETNKYGVSFKDGAPNLDALIYELDEFNNTIKDSRRAIPMWGVKTYMIPEDTPANSSLDLESITMLRAAAKIGVKLGEELKNEGYVISDIKLNYANSTGFCLPKNSVWQHANTKFTENVTHAGSFNPRAKLLSKGINAMARGSQTDGYYIYVPETKNSDKAYTPENGDTTTDLSLSVTLTNGAETLEFPYENGIRFCTYDEGKPTGELMDIVRNHFYDFTITDINVGMKVSLDVADWYDAPEWNLDFSAPVHTKLLVSPRDAAPDPMEEPTVAYSNINDEDGAFVGYFKMESPEGVSWKPTLTNASAGDFEVRVYTNGQTNPGEYDIPVTEPEIMASENQFFKIVVVAKNPNLVDKVVKLGISYTSSWNDENSLLLINKDEYGLYYPWIDNDPTDSKDDPDEHWISIKQVSSK